MNEHLDAYGWSIIPGVSVDLARIWADDICQAAWAHGTRIDRDATGTHRFLDEGGAYRHWTLDSEALIHAVPAIRSWYETLPGVLTEAWGRDVILSPYPRSALTGKVYSRPGDCQGWHRDTNPVTALLCLTAVEGDWGTNIVDRTGTTRALGTIPGDLVVFHGRELRHYVPPLPAGVGPRVTIPANLYHPDDTWRPDGIDDLVYGGPDA